MRIIDEPSAQVFAYLAEIKHSSVKINKFNALRIAKVNHI